MATINIEPTSKFVTHTKSDTVTTAYDGKSRVTVALMVDVAGTLIMQNSLGVAVTKALLAGAIYPYRVSIIKTGGTATGITVYFDENA